MNGLWISATGLAQMATATATAATAASHRAAPAQAAHGLGGARQPAAHPRGRRNFGAQLGKAFADPQQVRQEQRAQRRGEDRVQHGRPDHPAGFGGNQRLPEHRDAEVAHLQQRAAEIVLQQIQNVPVDQEGRQQPKRPLPPQRPVHSHTAAAGGAEPLLPEQHPNGDEDQQVKRREHERVEGENQRDAGVGELQFAEDERGDFNPRQQAVQIAHALEGEEQQKIRRRQRQRGREQRPQPPGGIGHDTGERAVRAVARIAQE